MRVQMRYTKDGDKWFWTDNEGQVRGPYNSEESATERAKEYFDEYYEAELLDFAMRYHSAKQRGLI